MRTKLGLMTVTTLAAIAFAMASSVNAQRASVPASEVNGTFRMPFTGKFKGSSNEIKILALGKGKLHIAMELLYPYIVNGEMSANLGELDATASIDGDTAIYESDEFGPCKITIKFVRAGTITIDQDGSDADCGFGHNVTSGGTYKKVSSAKPKFDAEH